MLESTSVMKEYIANPVGIPWRQGQAQGITFKCQVFLSGMDGGPEALRFRFDPCPSVFAHMHLTSQFQLLLHGRMDFPKSTMKLRGVAVHYTDHNFPYGPFAVSDNHDMLVLHPKRGGLVSMADRDARRQINLGGRHLHRAAADTEWTYLPEFESVSAKPLISIGSGPSAVMIECLPRTLVKLPYAPYGRYEVILAGTASTSGQEIGSPGLRYVRGDEPPSFWEAGPEGATMMLLAFDYDANAGGLTGPLAVAAAAAMERAI
jgi:hypothetical protein